jgi:DNA-binding response OmpR family regulator
MKTGFGGKKYTCISPNPRILYVDDDRDACVMFGMMLHLADDSYEITAVSSAQRALALMEKQPIALFILDYHLPEISGVELCRKIRQTDSQTPIVFYSAMSREIDRSEAMTAGATEYLVKPKDLERLVETVKSLLDKSPVISKEQILHQSRNI